MTNEYRFEGRRINNIKKGVEDCLDMMKDGRATSVNELMQTWLRVIETREERHQHHSIDTIPLEDYDNLVYNGRANHFYPSLACMLDIVA